MDRIVFKLPRLGMTMQEAVVEEWLVAPGEGVAEGQDLVVISTDKVESALPSPAAGTVGAILAVAGEAVEPGATLAIIDPE